MNFERFKSRVRAAADAAREFRGFDTMAAQDEYVNSDSLNVKRKTKSGTEMPASSLQTREEHLNSLVMPTATAAAAAAAASLDDSSIHRPARLGGTPGGTPTSPNNEDSDDEDWDAGGSNSYVQEHDPILHMIRTARNDDSSTSSQQEDPLSLSQRKKQRNVHRFMENLDARLSRSNTDVEQGRVQLEAMEMEMTDKPQTQTRWNGWLQSARKSILSATGQRDQDEADHERVPSMSPLRRTPLSLPKEETENDEEQQLIQLVASSAVLGAEEQAELERMQKAAQSSGDPVSMLLHLVKHNPQFTFIAFTLILAWAVYFYSRHRGSQDDVT